MTNSGQKTGFSIAVMISVIIAAGVGVDWWDAHQSRKAGKPAEVVVTDQSGMKMLMEENERLKTENALLNIKNDGLRKQLEQLAQKPLDLGKPTEVTDNKPAGD